MAFSVQKHYTIKVASEEDLIYVARKRLLSWHDDPNYDQASLPMTADEAMIQLIALFEADPTIVGDLVQVVSYRMKELPL